jgi:hypothetical protein
MICTTKDTVTQLLTQLEIYKDWAAGLALEALDFFALRFFVNLLTDDLSPNQQQTPHHQL